MHGVLILAVFFGMAMLIVLWLAPPIVERLKNKVSASPAYSVRSEANELHQRLFVADLHADSLLWQRDLLKRAAYGHVDLPRAIEGNVALQVFGVVTKCPQSVNIYHNAADSDVVTALLIVQAWPFRTWGSLLQRALYQADKLRQLAARSEGRLLLIKSVRDLDELLARRQTDPQVVGAFPALEGAQALEGRLANLKLLYEAGFRMIGLTHFFDNEAAGSAHGVAKGGLTPFGRELVHAIQAQQMVIDLAHASPQTIAEVLKLAAAPVVVSHTGVRGTCDNPRNLSDDQIRRIAATGGVMGIAMFESAVCGATVQDTAKAMRYVARLVGSDYVAVGSDFDGTITAPMDVSGMARLTEALLDQKFTAEEIARIMGGNVLRVLRAILPKI